VTPTDLLGRALSALTSRGAARVTDDIRKREHTYIYYSDDDLRAAAMEYISGDLTTFARDNAGLLIRLLTMFLRSSTDERELSGLAIAAAAFRRAPADIRGEHPQLFDSQLAAASFIVSGRHVQMDTGEGKTYALIAAAFAALGRVERVYILTANELLAERDALRTRPFWHWLGISVGLCTAGYGTAASTDPAWGAQVIYTTADGLAFKYANDAMGQTQPENPIIHGIILLDETDAILFDGRSDTYAVTTNFATDPQSWNEAFGFARTLTEDDVDDQFLLREALFLNPRGWEKLTTYHIDTAGLSLWRFARMVEAAYIALHNVRRDIDYRAKGRRLNAISRYSGLTTASRPDWLIALSNTPDFDPIPSSEEIYSVSLLTLLRSFETVGGASGTAASVALDVWLILGSQGLPAAVEAREPRLHFQPEDMIYRNRRTALAAAASDALQEANSRPVLVGAQNARDARDFHALLVVEIGRLQAPPDIELVLEDNWSVRSFDDAGSVGRITITSYFAARGTDIRLDAAARSAGGLHLTLLGRSREGRLDRQFLGRAGRQGDPWTARVFSSLDMDLFQAFATGTAGRVMKMTLPDNVPLESRMVSNALARAQRTATRQRQSVAAMDTMLSESTASFHATYERVHRAMQRFGSDDSLGFDVTRWLAESLMERSNQAGAADTVAAFVADALAGATHVDELVAAVARSSDPATTAVERISELIARAVAARLDDIADHMRYHEALDRFLSALSRARALNGQPREQRESRTLPVQLQAMVELATHLETAVAEREHAPTDAAAVFPEPVAADTGGLEPHRPAPTDEALELAGIAWSISTPCLQANGCPQLTRSPRAALSWEAHRIWRTIAREREAAFLEIAIADVSYGAKTQRRAMVTQMLTEKMERQLASRLVWVLLSLDRWATMDETFYVRDRRVRWTGDQVLRRGEWTSPPPKPGLPGDRVDLVIRSLVRDAPEDEQEDIDRIVRAFLRAHPISAIQTGRACADAMTRFEEEDIARGVSYRQRRQNLVRISEFLAAAQAAQLIPEVPSRWDRVGSRAKRAALTVRYARHLDAAVALPSLVLLVVVASLLSYDVPFTDRTDALPLVAAWALFTTAAYVLLMSITPDKEQQFRVFENLTPLLAVIALLVSLARCFFADDGFSVGLVTSSFVAAFIAFFMWRFIAILRIRVGIDVLAGVGVVVGLVAILLLALPEHVGWALAVLCAGAVEAIRTWFDRENIQVIGGSVESLHREATRVDTFVTVRLGSALGRYTVATIAMLVYALWPARTDVFATTTTLQVLALVGGALVLLTVVDLLRRTAPAVVRTVLARRRVVAQGDEADLEQRLVAARRHISVRELVAISLTLAGAAVLAAPSSASSVGTATSMYVGVLLATLIIRFVTSAQSSFAGFASNVVVLDYDPPVSGAREGSIISRALGRVPSTRRLWAIVAGAYILIVHILDFLDVVGLLRRGWDSLWDVFF
jgi:preprotein translocase subunit SecA